MRRATPGWRPATTTAPPRRSASTTVRSTTPRPVKEGLINAWPLDEAYIDYVEGDTEAAGIVNDPDTFPTIDADLLVSLNEEGGEANISTGWHAIEFLLWGQDLSLDGPGERPVVGLHRPTPNADRRVHLPRSRPPTCSSSTSPSIVDAWAPDAENYRADFEARELGRRHGARIITGIGELSRGELAGERMNVAYTERSREDEHSCFSDNTTADIVGNARGIEMVLTAVVPGRRLVAAACSICRRRGRRRPRRATRGAEVAASDRRRARPSPRRSTSTSSTG